MAAKLEKLEGNKAKLSIEVSAEKFEEGVKKAFQKMKGRFSIPGFRKGKAPRAMVENHYGPEIFYEDAFEEIFPESYQEAVEEHELEVVSRPDIDILSIDKDGVQYVAEVVLKPEVKLGKYEGIKVSKPTKKIAAKDVDAEIEKIRDQNARWVDVERAAKDKDSVNIDFEGSLDGVPFEGGAAKGQTLILGAGNFIPGFEEQIVGMKTGEEKDIDVTFPEQYAEGLAGKDAVFAIKVNSVKERELPEVDDDFAQDVSEFETLADYKKDLKKQLQKKADDEAKAEVENQLLEAVAENAKMDIPDVMVESEIDYEINQLNYQLMYQGMKIEDYLQYAGITMDELRDQYRANATKQVRMMLTVQQLIKELNLDATDEEVVKKIEELAKEMDKTVDEYKKVMGGNPEERIKNSLIMEKLLDFLTSKAVIEEGEPKKEAPAKKPAAKKTEEKSAAKKPAAKKTEEKPAAKKAEAKPAAKKQATASGEKKPAAKKPAAKKTTEAKKDEK